MKNKMTVHNEMEIKALIKESFAHGDEIQFNGTAWFSHSGEFICKSSIDHTDFELLLANGSSVTVEVL